MIEKALKVASLERLNKRIVTITLLAILLAILIFIFIKTVKKIRKQNELKRFENQVNTLLLSYNADSYKLAANQLQSLLDPPYLINFNAAKVGDEIKKVCKNKDDLYYLISVYGIDPDGFTLYNAILKKFENREIQEKIINKQNLVVGNELKILLNFT